MTMTMTAPPLPRRTTSLPPLQGATSQKRVCFAPPMQAKGMSIGIYGDGGIGKTTMACAAPGPVAVLDLDDSLRVLQIPGVRVVSGIATWQDMRDALQSDGWDDIKTVVIDSVSKAEDLAVEHVCATIKHEKGHKVDRIEDYGYGKGYRHLYDEIIKILSDCDRHIRAGRNVILIAHECVALVPNPAGDDWKRHEPRLYTSDKNQLRQRVRDWLDHLFFLGYDVDVKDGKGRGSGTRTIYCDEMPHCMAKSRTIHGNYAVTLDSGSFWDQIFKGE